MVNPEKLATQGTQDQDKQNKSTTQYVFVEIDVFDILIFIFFHNNDVL